MDLLPRGNDALKINSVSGVDINETLAIHGSDWLWAVTAIFSIALIGCLVMSFAAKESERVFHYLFTFVLLVGAITYFTQASDLGWSAVKQADGNESVRQMFWVKYVYWAIAFPSLALGLGLLSGVSWTTIICNIASSMYWVISYLAGAYVTTSYKWGFFAFGTFAWLILAMSTINESREAAQHLGVDRDYIILSGWTNLLWIIYPIAWGLTDGSNKIGVTGTSIFFGVLDVLMVPVLSFAVLIFARKWNYHKLNIAFSDSRPSQASIRGGV